MSQLERLCDKLRIKADCQYGGVEATADWQRQAHPYKVTLRMGRRRLTVPFFMGPAHESEPTPADVLWCLVRDASAGDQDFDGFCDDFGCDKDSREAERTWKACRDMAPRVKRFLGDSFDEIASAEH